eukprot:352001-Chlamydomonas_euryale.AAC.4
MAAAAFRALLQRSSCESDCGRDSSPRDAGAASAKAGGTPPGSVGRHVSTWIRLGSHASRKAKHAERFSTQLAGYLLLPQAAAAPASGADAAAASALCRAAAAAGAKPGGFLLAARPR